MHAGTTNVIKKENYCVTRCTEKCDETVCKRIEPDITDDVISECRTQAGHFICCMM